MWNYSKTVRTKYCELQGLWKLLENTNAGEYHMKIGTNATQ